MPSVSSRATWRARPCSTAIRRRRPTPSKRQGFEYLHIVDLDGAFAGKPVNAAAVDRILENVSIPVQLGGGVRDMATVEGWLDKGVTRVIIGTAAVRDPDLVKEAAREFPDRVAVGLDARDGKVAVEGWAEASELSALDIAKRFEDAGVGAIIYTDISRDGMLQGLNLDATIALADAISIPVIASGGLASIDDIKAMLAPRAAKLEGAIAGRALYDGRLDPAEALTLIWQSRGEVPAGRRRTSATNKEARLIKRLMILALVLIVLFAALPVLLTVTGSAVAGALGCPLNEGGAHACMLFGHDIGGALSVMFASHWFAYVTIPGAVAALVVWIVAALILLVLRHWRRRRCCRTV